MVIVVIVMMLPGFAAGRWRVVVKNGVIRATSRRYETFAPGREVSPYLVGDRVQVMPLLKMGGTRSHSESDKERREKRCKGNAEENVSLKRIREKVASTYNR